MIELFRNLIIENSICRIMKTHRSNSSTGAVQSFGLALIASIAIAVVYQSIIVNSLVDNEVITGSLGLFIYGVLNAICCFLIVRQNPFSIWFVPLIMNAFIIALTFMEPDYLRISFWLPVCGGSLLCIIASIAGAWLGNTTTTSHSHLRKA
ncbi:MAG TPA: hypothetical protein DCL77_16260 [Prolixibacteraceae bacterium]|nr:hypothetical protein [Prolixibacteraceae bacterium]